MGVPAIGGGPAIHLAPHWNVPAEVLAFLSDPWADPTDVMPALVEAYKDQPCRQALVECHSMPPLFYLRAACSLQDHILAVVREITGNAYAALTPASHRSLDESRYPAEVYEGLDNICHGCPIFDDGNAVGALDKSCFAFVLCMELVSPLSHSSSLCPSCLKNPLSSLATGITSSTASSTSRSAPCSFSSQR
jgi:hypothetical protein